jgi:alkylhydroperoxidase family enzyme
MVGAMTWAPQMDVGDTVLDRAVNHRPEYAAAMRGVEAAIWSQSVVDPVVLELCRLRIAQLLGAPIGFERTRPEAQRAGLTEAHVSRLAHWPTDPAFSPRQRVCLGHCEQMLIDAAEIDDAHAAVVIAEIGADGYAVLSYACGFFETTQRAELILGSTNGR